MRRLYAITNPASNLKLVSGIAPVAELLKRKVSVAIGKADILAKGKFAALILLDLNRSNMQPVHNIPKNIIYSGSKSNVLMTMVGGKILYNKKLNIERKRKNEQI